MDEGPDITGYREAVEAIQDFDTNMSKTRSEIAYLNKAITARLGSVSRESVNPELKQMEQLADVWKGQVQRRLDGLTSSTIKAINALWSHAQVLGRNNAYLSKANADLAAQIQGTAVPRCLVVPHEHTPREISNWEASRLEDSSVLVTKLAKHTATLIERYCESYEPIRKVWWKDIWLERFSRPFRFIVLRRGLIEDRLSIDIAESMFEALIAQMEETLIAGRTFYIKGIGTIVSDSDGIYFVPSEKTVRALQVAKQTELPSPKKEGGSLPPPSAPSTDRP